MTAIDKAKHDKFISFVRAFSIITIVLYHYFKDLALPTVLSKATVLGGGGIYLFFFASGYGLFLSKYTNYVTFIKKRFAKVLIPYYIAITTIFILNLFLKLYAEGFDAWLSHVFLYKMFFEQYQSSFGGQFWFISTLIQLYLVFPLLLVVVKKYNSLNCMLVSLSISIAYAVITASTGIDELRTVSRFFLQYVWVFILGMVVAKEGLMERIVQIKWPYTFGLAITSYATMIILALKGGALGKQINDPFSFIGYLGVSICLYRLLNGFKPALNFILLTEGISYSLFLMHFLVFDFCSKYIFHPILPVDVPIVFVAAIAVSSAFNYAIYTIPGYFTKTVVSNG